MKVNLNKIFVFRNGGPLREYEQWTLNDMPIRTTSEYTYMGLYLHPSSLGRTPSVNLQHKPEKRHFVYEINNANFDEIFRLFDAMVKPVLCFGSEYGDMSTRMLSSLCTTSFINIV